MDSKIQKLEDRIIEIDKEIALKEKEMRDLSRKVSEIQVDILELKTEKKTTIKIINHLKGK
jgi:uncharacterized coiled-coil protein SlyX